MVFNNNLLLGAAGASAGYTIDQSIRFNDNDSAYLFRTPSSAGNRKTWTFSSWVKRANLFNGSVPQIIFSAANGSTLDFIMQFGQSDDTLRISDYSSGSASNLITTQLFRDPSAWYHFVLQYDTTQATSSDRMKLYVNGTQVTVFGTASYPSLNYDSAVNNNLAHNISRGAYSANGYFDGYQAETHFIDGTALDATNFGEYNADTGQWVPIAYTGSYGTNGFYITGEDSTFLGQDVRTSGDQVNSFQSSQYTGATGDYTFSDGQVEANTSNRAIRTVDTFTGDFEFTWRYVNMANFIFGLYEIDEDATFSSTSSAGNMQNMTDSWYVQTSSVAANRDIYYGGTVVVESTTIANGDVWKMTRESGTIKVYRNGSLVHTFTQTSTNEVRLVIAQGDSAADANQIAWVDNSTLGNNFFSSGLAAADQVPDTPTPNADSAIGNRATLMSNQDGSATMSEGNTRFSNSGGTRIQRTTNQPLVGKTYWEVLVNNATQNTAGVSSDQISVFTNDTFYNQTTLVAGFDNANFYYNGSFTTYSQPSATQRWMFAYDADTGELWSGVNGTWHNSGDPAAGTGQIATLSTSYKWFPFIGGKSGADQQIIWGASNMSHTIPTGFTADLSTYRQPDPTIADPSAYFQTSLWNGNGSTQTITQDGNSTFQPGWIWSKGRNNAQEHVVFDEVRGTTKYLKVSPAGTEATQSGVTAFNSDGFDLGSWAGTNGSGQTHVGWQWKAGGTSGSSNTDGSITSTVSADTTSGFSIATYTGNATVGATVGHGLGVAPKMVIVKSRSNAENWVVGHDSLGWTKGVYLNSASAPFTLDIYWNNTAPTSSVVELHDHPITNGSGYTYVMYSFAEVEGFSKFGIYTGNGSTDGAFVYTGFKPAFLLWKQYTNLGTNSWGIRDSARDPYNVVESVLRPDTAGAETTASSAYADFLSNGFKQRATDGFVNKASSNYLYMAFAESPFKTTTAR